MKPPLLAFLWLFPLFHTSSVTIPTSGQCQAICLKEFAISREFFTLTGDVFQEVDVSNNTEFLLCKLGCQSPDFSELSLPAFRRGQIAYHNVIEKANDGPLPQSPIRRVSLLCGSSHPNGSVTGRVLLEGSALSADHVVHYAEAVARQGEEELVFWSTWSYSSLVDFSAALDLSNRSVQFRVNSFGADVGFLGTSRSSWIEGAVLEETRGMAVEAELKRQMWRDDAAAAIISFPDSRLSVCALSISIHSLNENQQNIQITMDRSRGFLLEKLLFDRSYDVRVESSAVSSSREDSPVLRIKVPPCLEMVQDMSMCAPPPVTNIDWKWNASSSQGHTVILSWEYAISQEMASANRSFPRMVHFDVAIRPLATTAQPGCETIESHRRVVTWTHRSVVLYMADDRCDFEVEVTVVDSRNRRSTTARSPVARFDHTNGVLALTAKWNTEMFLLLSFLIAILLIAGGLAVCRARDRNEFNTLKKEHRQLTKSIVVAQSASTLPRSQCLTVVDGRGRPISSDHSDLSSNNQSETVRSSIPAQRFYSDEGVYDSLDTPTRSEVSYFDRMSSGSFQRANPIYSGINLHGTVTIPMDSLHMTMFTRLSGKSCTVANVIDKRDAANYSIKYSNEDSACLRHELGVVSRISTDHPNLIYFHGVAVRDSQVLGMLWEPHRGGSLASFLTEVKAVLGDRSQATPSPNSSGYNGSNNNDSMDRWHSRMDALVINLYRFARQITAGLSFLHAQRTYHGNVSTDSVFLLKSFQDPLHLPCDQIVKIGQYDHCGQVDGSPSPHPCEHERSAPEVSMGKQHNTQSDMWQLGLLLCELVCLGSLLSLWEASGGSISEKTVKNYYSRLGSGIDNCNRIDPALVALKQKIPRCLNLEPKKRTTAKELERELGEIQPEPRHSEHMESVEV